MSYWYCPNCHAGLYWLSHKVRSGQPSGQGKCPFCEAALSVRAPRTLWLIALLGWLGFVLAVLAYQLPSTFADLQLPVQLSPRTSALAALALQLPLLILGPRFDALPRQTVVDTHPRGESICH